MPSLEQKRAAERARLEALVPSEVDHRADEYGVLLSDQIIFYAENHHLISPFKHEYLKPAGYELTVGDEYFISGEYLNVSLDRPETARITIPPFEVAVIKTRETLCLPRYLIARWNIRVKHAYSGLLWVGGPQVDPGYVGHLFCPIYNLSDKPVTLNFGDALALMDFVKTTPFDGRKPASALKRYPLPPKRLIIQDYGIDDLKSALFTRAGEKLAEFDETIRTFETRFVTFTQISFVIFSMVIALIVASKAGETITLGASIWGPLTIGISVAALLIAFFSYIQWRVGKLVPERYGQIMANRAREVQRILRRWWLLSLATSILLALGAGIGAYCITEPFLRDIRQQHVVTKSDLDSMQEPTKAAINSILGRLDRIDAQRTLTLEEIEKLRSNLEQQIQDVRTPPIAR